MPGAVTRKMLKRTFILLTLLTIPSISTSAGPSLRVYVNKKCGYSFAYPSTWRIVPNPSDNEDESATMLRPRNYAKVMKEYDVDVYTIVISSDEGGFEQGAEDAGFSFISESPDYDLGPREIEFVGEWVISGRQGILSPSEPLTVGTYSGLQGSSTSGCFHEHGGYAGLCDVPLAFLTNGRRYVSVTGGAQSDPFDIIVKNICINE